MQARRSARPTTARPAWPSWPALWLAALVALLALAGCGGSGNAPSAPTISAQPVDTAATAGQVATLSVGAEGTDLAYQWQTSSDGGTTWSNLAGATAALHTTSPLGAGDDGKRYRVVVSAAGASVTSSAVRLTVTAGVVAPALAVAPAAASVVAPASALFSVTASGTAPTYQWQRSTDGGASFADIAGATGVSFDTGATVASMDGQRYRVVVGNAAGSVTSAAALLTVGTGPSAPVFTQEPADQSVAVGSAATFAVVAHGAPAPTLQWQRSTDGGSTWADIGGAVSASYSTGPTSPSQDGERYRAVAANGAGTTNSGAARLTVGPAQQAPSITAQPASRTVTVPSTATFTAQASGTPTPSWQWQLSADGGATFANINGATGASYSTAATTAADNGKRFRAVATNVAGSATSTAAVLTVTAPAGRMVSARFNHTSTLLGNGKVLVAAGVIDGSSGGFFSSAEAYDPGTGLWSTVASLAGARGYHTATRLADGRVLIVGGLGAHPGGGAPVRLASAELYDPVANTWSPVGSLGTARAHHAATLLANGKVLVTGGSSNNANQTIDSAELFDPVALTWSAAASLLQLRQGHHAVRLNDGRVMLVGGGHQGSLATTELYDPSADAWSLGASMATPRNHSSATLLANGKVLAIGGWDQLGIGVVGSAELYDPASNTWSAAGTLVVGRYGHAAALLGDGRVLVAAGIGSTVLLAAEIYDPVGNSWSATASLVTARHEPASTVLANGEVLVSGGNSAAGAALSSAEVYDPLTATWE